MDGVGRGREKIGPQFALPFEIKSIAKTGFQESLLQSGKDRF
jgi:hypothetical protein